ncbi:MAG: glycosyltransferase [Candidatus Aminicenantes bacterium]|nr:glycosyltransferase [Candidatus Aminicenantes bacterium]
MISVIIPTYNRAGFLEEAILSVLDQDYFLKHPDFELWVVDDGSQDFTRDLVKDFGNKVLYLYQSNRGVSSARNLGLEVSSGEFVAFLDSDDLWKPQKLSRQMAFMCAHPEAVCCCTEEIWIRRGKLVNPRNKHRKYSGWVFDKFLPLCLLSLSSALFRRRTFAEIGSFDEELPACEDYDLGLRLAHSYPVDFIPEALIVKRGGHGDQLSRKYWGMDRFRVTAILKALQFDLSPQERAWALEELQNKCRVLILGFLKRGKQDSAQTYINILQDHGLDI